MAAKRVEIVDRNRRSRGGQHAGRARVAARTAVRTGELERHLIEACGSGLVTALATALGPVLADEGVGVETAGELQPAGETEPRQRRAAPSLEPPEERPETGAVDSLCRIQPFRFHGRGKIRAEKPLDLALGERAAEASSRMRSATTRFRERGVARGAGDHFQVQLGVRQPDRMRRGGLRMAADARPADLLRARALPLTSWAW